MKKALVVLLAVALVAFAVGSSNAQGKITFGVGADVALPMTSGFSDGWNIGIGGTAKGYYTLDPMTTLTATAGYMMFSGKEIASIAGTTYKAGTWSMIPVVVGGRYYFGPASSSFRPYGAFEVGLIFSSYTQEIPNWFGTGTTSVSFSGSDFTYQPQIGFEANNFDVAVRLIGVSGATSVGARFGYIFN